MKRFLFLFMAVLMMAGTAKADVEWTVWEGENTDNVYIPKDLVANMEVGDKIFVSFKQTDEGQDGDLCIGWNTIAYKYMAEGYTDYFDYTNNIVTITITETLKKQVAGTTAYTKYYWDNEWKTEEVTQAGDLRIRANESLKFTSIVLQKQKSFIVKSYDVTVSTGNYEKGTYVFPSGLTSDDYLYFNATTTSNPDGYWQAQLGDLGTIGVVGGFWFPVTTYYNTFNTNGPWLGGKYINVTGMKQYHPVNSFKIGSIGMATFSADQEVTVPEGLTAYKATISGDNVSLTPFTDNVIPANTGAIIAGDEGSVLEFVASSTGSTEASELIACTTATNVSSLEQSGFDLYVLYNNPTGGNTPLDLTKLECGWDSSYDSGTKTITFDDEWKGRGWGWNFDYSDYSKVVVEFESAAKSGHLSVQYNGSNTTESADYAEGATSVEIDLNASLKSNIMQIYLSASAASTLTLTNAYLVSNSGSQKAEFRKTTSGKLAANKAYLKLASGSNSARLSIVFNDDDSETTGVLDVQKHTTQSDNVYYNLRGMQVDKPTKGLYIMNGKKVIVK